MSVTTLPPIHQQPLVKAPTPPPLPSQAATVEKPTGGEAELVEADGTAVALAELRERLPPIQPPATVPFKRRPVPLSFSHVHSGGKPKQPPPVDFDKELIRIDSKQHAQQRAATEADEQHSWTKLLLEHLHALAALEENIIYRECGGREGLVREEDRLFMMLFVEFETRLQRIRGRELVGIQLKKHLLAIEQDDNRKGIASEEVAAFAHICHREVIYRPSAGEEALGGTASSSSLVGRQLSKQHRSTGGRSPSRPQDVKKPIPPRRPVNSARTEDTYVSNGRVMWGSQKSIRMQQSKADAAIAGLPPYEQLQREDIEGSELGGRLGIERMFFDETHLVGKREATRLERVQEEASNMCAAHAHAAVDVVQIVMDRVITTTAGSLPPESYAPPPAQAVHTEALHQASLAESSAPVATEDSQSLTKPRRTSQTIVRSRSTSLTRMVEVPVQKEEKQRLIAACAEAVEEAIAARTAAGLSPVALTSMELVEIVDEVNQKLFLCAADELWKTSGIASLRMATQNQKKPIDAPPAEAVPQVHDGPPAVSNPSSSTNGDAANVGDQNTVHPTRPQQPVVASPPRGLLFPGIDLLCDVMLDADSIDAFTPWKIFLSAVMEIENNNDSEAAEQEEAKSDAAPSSRVLQYDPSPYVRRLYEGHRNAMLNRDYLENVLWRVDRMHQGGITALELMPTRWKTYANPKELEDEEISEVILGEVVAREKILRDQISQFCHMLYYSSVRMQSASPSPSRRN